MGHRPTNDCCWGTSLWDNERPAGWRWTKWTSINIESIQHVDRCFLQHLETMCLLGVHFVKPSPVFRSLASHMCCLNPNFLLWFNSHKSLCLVGYTLYAHKDPYIYIYLKSFKHIYINIYMYISSSFTFLKLWVVPPSHPVTSWIAGKTPSAFFPLWKRHGFVPK